MAVFYRQNVKIDHCCTEIKEAIRLLDKKQHKVFQIDFMVLSADDSLHGTGSLHNPSGQAIDFECKLSKQEIFNTVKHLGFRAQDIISYPWGWHMEFQRPYWISLYTLNEKIDNMLSLLAGVESKIDRCTFKSLVT